MKRRAFLKTIAGSTLLASAAPWVRAEPSPKSSPVPPQPADDATLHLLDAHRPSRLKVLPPDFNARVGATHVAGTYHFTEKPFLVEGAQKLLELGTRLGKFYFSPGSTTRNYPFNSRWPVTRNFIELAKTDYWQRVFALPFSTIILQAESSVEGGWKEEQPASYYEAVTEDFYQIASWLYQHLRDRPVTVVLQHWEGDWLLRGRGGELWTSPPSDWRLLCERMQKWLAARQAGVTRARAAVAAGHTLPLCRVAHATEVNRVMDQWKGIPTMTEHVLPGVELDLISYSAYDGMNKPLDLWRCLNEIKKRARTTPFFGKNAVYIGEMGIPENEHTEHVEENWDKLLGAALAAEVQYIVHWELYCNELNPKLHPPPKMPVKQLTDVRGFWLVRPDGSLGVAGRYFQGLWKRALAQQ